MHVQLGEVCSMFGVHFNFTPLMRPPRLVGTSLERPDFDFAYFRNALYLRDLDYETDLDFMSFSILCTHIRLDMSFFQHR